MMDGRWVDGGWVMVDESITSQVDLKEVINQLWYFDLQLLLVKLVNY